MKPLLPKIFPLSLEGEGVIGGEGASNWAKNPDFEIKNEAIEK